MNEIFYRVYILGTYDSSCRKALDHQTDYKSFLEAEEVSENSEITEMKENDAMRHPRLPWVELGALAQEIEGGLEELKKEKKTDTGMLEIR